MNARNPILILECANAHGGDLKTLYDTVEKFSSIQYPVKHIKFQPFHPDALALPDYEWYPIYKSLSFSIDEWSKIISFSSERYVGVWLDIFDLYGVEILFKNMSSIHGVKLQASVLENAEVFEAIKKVEINRIDLILNVSGHGLNKIYDLIGLFEGLNPRRIILQIGFQSYPTKVEDAGLQKIDILRASFPNYPICIADHTAPDNMLSMLIPLLAHARGCTHIEKHIILKRMGSKYDFQSSLNFDEMQLFSRYTIEASKSLNGRFISIAEMDYLNKSIELPVTKMRLRQGSMVSDKKVIYRRTSQSGLTFSEIREIQRKGHVMASDLRKSSTIVRSNFRKARVGVFVACRLKSTRLKNKALLTIGEKTSLEWCLDHCKKFNGADIVLLATSTEDEDMPLCKYAKQCGVELFTGHPDDVIRRYLDAAKLHDIDVIVRVTADCPFVSSDIFEILLDDHFSSGADYTCASNACVGSACEIYNRSALEEVMAHVKEATYSEYMTWYMKNNQHLFDVRSVDLPDHLSGDYRLTLDFQDDLDMFNRLIAEIEKDGATMDLATIIKTLDANPEISAMNQSIPLKYVVDSELIALLNEKTFINV